MCTCKIERYLFISTDYGEGWDSQNWDGSY